MKHDKIVNTNSTLMVEETPDLSEEHFRHLISSIQDYAIFMIDPTGHIISWNQGAQNIKGYHKDEILGKHFSCFYSKKDLAQHKPEQLLRNALSKGRVEDEGWRIRKDGSRFWANVMITAMRDEQNHLIGFSKITRDLTERKQHEEALKNHTEQLTHAYNALQTVIQSAPLAIFTTDLNGIVTSWNKTAEHIFGWTESECIGQFLPIVDQAHLKEFDIFRKTVCKGHSIIEEPIERKKKDGTTIHASLSAAPLKDTEGNVLGYLGIVADLTERHEYEQQIAYQKKILDNVNDAIIATDQNLCITSWNNAAEDIYGWKATEVLGRTTTEVLQSKMTSHIRQTKLQELQKKGVVKGTFEHKKRNGNPIFIEAHAMTLTNDQGQCIGYVSVNRDITQRIQAEEELQAQRALSVRSDRLRALGEMATGMAHEINQPLQGIRGLAERCLFMAKRGHAPTTDEMLKRFDEIIQQTERMEHIVKHTRNFVREARQPITQRISINEVIENATKLLTAQFRERGVYMVFKLAEDLPLINANPYSLEEVIINLLLNARDAIESRLETEPKLQAPHIVIQTQKTKDQLQTLITDRGTGISPKIYSHIFEPFFTTKSSDRGTGLGLSISKTLVEQFGGTLKIASNSDGGVQAIVELPAGKPNET